MSDRDLLQRCWEQLSILFADDVPLLVDLRARLAQSEPEPELKWISTGVTHIYSTGASVAQPEVPQRTGGCLLTGVCAAEGHRIQKAQREWQGLTTAETKALWNSTKKPSEFAALLQAKLREKNERDA
jgi:hypothetical protein